MFQFGTFSSNFNTIVIILTKKLNVRLRAYESLLRAVAIHSVYRIVASTSPSCIEAHADLFRLLMKGILDPYVL